MIKAKELSPSLQSSVHTWLFGSLFRLYCIFSKFLLTFWPSKLLVISSADEELFSETAIQGIKIGINIFFSLLAVQAWGFVFKLVFEFTIIVILNFEMYEAYNLKEIRHDDVKKTKYIQSHVNDNLTSILLVIHIAHGHLVSLLYPSVLVKMADDIQLLILLLILLLLNRQHLYIYNKIFSLYIYIYNIY